MKYTHSTAASQTPLAATDSDERLTATLTTSRALFDAPEAVIERAIALFVARSQQPTPAAAPGPLRRLIATLRLDTALAPMASLGLRSGASAGTAAVRQLLYSAEGRDIDLRLTPLSPRASNVGEARRWRLSGQVLGPDASGQAVLRSDAEHHAVIWNELSEFSFDTVQNGPVILTLRSDDWEVELPPIELDGPNA
jgi:hypothetical protein